LAGNTNILVTNKKLKCLKHKIQNIREKLQSWFHISNLMINMEKNGDVISYQTKQKSIKTTSQI